MFCVRPWIKLHFLMAFCWSAERLFFLFCIYNDVICKAEVGNKLSSDADTTFMVIQCLAHDSL